MLTIFTALAGRQVIGVALRVALTAAVSAAVAAGVIDYELVCQ